VTKAPDRGHKDDRRRNDYCWVIQKGPQNLPLDGTKCSDDGSCVEDSTKRGPRIGFSEEDARRLHHPHDDALVVNLKVEDYNMHWVLVDNGSSVDILYYPAFQQMRIDREQLISTNAPLVGFGGSRVFPLGTVTLSVMVGDYSQQITKDVTFLVVNCSSAYNAILG